MQNKNNLQKNTLRPWVYWTMNSLLQILLRTLFRFKVIGRDNVPANSVVIIAANHLSYVDPVFIGTALGKRRLRMMAKSEAFKIPFIGSFISVLGAFPVARSVGRGAIQAAVDMVRGGESLLLFPEGTRSRTGKLGEARSGLGWIIHETRVVVIPVSISGSEHILPVGGKMIKFFGKIEVRFGEPIKLEDFFKMEKNKDTFTLITQRVMSDIVGLQESVL